jgi:formamidopyrimidine-DNA glycosylase
LPELPEVETIRRGLAPAVEGLTIAAAQVVDPRWVAPADPADFESGLHSRRLIELARRGKYFVVRLSGGAVLLMHLRMTGNLLLIPEGEEPQASHLRGRIWLQSARGHGRGSIAFDDPRRFGTAELLADETSLETRLEARLGPEPFAADFNAAHLYACTRKRKTAIKALLLDQRTVAGIGNIYADEALFRAGISPRRRAARITKVESGRLTEAVCEALRAGIDAKGATIDDFRDAYGAAGTFQHQFLVHRREGLPCPLCASPIKKIRCAGRGTYYCPSCQS